MRADLTGTGRHLVIRFVCAAGLVGLIALLVTACGGTSTGSGVTIEQYRLYTHCGIDEALIQGKYYVADHPLSDGQGNPPAGWDNPYQVGTMKLVPPSQAVFTDSIGHHVTFRLHPGATSFRHVCS
ncbi:MAG: hypothetical protein J2P28_10930 [Actinobacteria bacterium]|nr:hypothetical protein [Actinomycetota bacterium]